MSSALLHARTIHGFSRIAGHQIVSAIGKTQALAGDGQSDIALIHRMIERFAQANGIYMDDDDFGDGRKPPVANEPTSA